MHEPLALINAYIDYSIDDEGFEALCQWLRADRDNRLTFARAMSDHAGIADWSSERSGGALTPELSTMEEPEIERSEWIKLLSALDSKPGQIQLVDLTDQYKRDSFFQNRNRWVLGGAGLAAAVLLVGVLLALSLMGPAATPNAPDLAGNTPSEPRESGPVGPVLNTAVATLTAAHNAQWGATAAERALARGSELKPGQRLTLTAGFAEITTNRGAIAIIEAPATIELLDNANALQLHSGKLVGICETDTSKGLLVRTPSMDITDLGTRFVVDADAKATEVHVLEGKVRASTNAAGGSSDARPKLLAASQSARASLATDVVVAIDYDTETYASLLSRAVHLPGTGEGLALNDKDLAWRVTAVDGQVLDIPAAMRVSSFTERFTADNPDPLSPTRMLRYRLTDGIQDAVCLIETTLRLPDHFAPDRQQLVVRFRADNLLKSFKVNGQAVQVPKQDGRAFGRDYAMVIDGPLQAGDNRFVFEVKNINVSSQKNVVGIQVAWELQPSATSQPEQNP